MKKLYCIVVFGILSANSVFAMPPLPTPENAEEVREAARLWLIEHEKYSAERFDYFAYHDEEKPKIHVLGGLTEFFSCSLQCDIRKGDLLLVIECTGKKKVEANLTYNIAHSAEGFNATNMDTQDSFSPAKKEFDTFSSEYRAPVLPERRGIVYLYAGEMYIKRIKIWDMKIWDDLLQAAEKQLDAKFKLEYRLVLKVDETFYVTKATCEIPARTIRAMRNVRATQELQAANAPPKAVQSDRQLRITITEGEKGESQIKLEPVRVESE